MQTDSANEPAVKLLLPPEAVGELIAALAGRGYAVLGPVIRDGAIVFDQVETIADLPAGWTAEEQPAQYRLKKRGDQALFGYPAGAQGNVVNAGVNELIIPNYKQTWANIRKLASAPEEVKGLSFKSQHYKVV